MWSYNSTLSSNSTCLSEFSCFFWLQFYSWKFVMDDKSEVISEDFYLPDYLLVPGSKATRATHVPPCPVIVFINSKSGGQLGGQLLVTYRSVLNKNQVSDLWIFRRGSSKDVAAVIFMRYPHLGCLCLCLRFLTWVKALLIKCCTRFMSL